MQPPNINGPTVPKPVWQLTSAMWAILPSWLYVRLRSKALLRARAVPRAPAALDPKPAPMGTSTRCLTVTWYVSGTFSNNVSTTVLVVSASGQSFPSINTRICFSFASARPTSVKTPLLITNPPPRAPICSGSVIGAPSGVLSQISKKLEIPAGLKALALLSTRLSPLILHFAEPRKERLCSLPSILVGLVLLGTVSLLRRSI